MPSPSVTLLRTQTDDRLAALAAGGHERAFEALVERYRRSLLRQARRYLPEARAEDAVQQALLSAWTALRRGDEVRELRPWLHRIVHNSALNALRAPGYDYDELRETLEGNGGPAELAERRSVVRGTLAGLAALPERQRDALLQIAVEGRSQDQVAEELGLTQNAVRQLVHRARTALRAAATAVVPMPFATWLATASAGRGDLGLRVGELVAGAGGSATLAKAGAVAVIAGGAVAGPAVVQDVGGRERSPAAASARAGGAPDAAAVPTPAPGSQGAGDANASGTPAGSGVPGGGPGELRHRDHGSSGSGDRTSGSGRHDDEPSSRRHDDDDEPSSGRHDDDGPVSTGDDDRSSGSRSRGEDGSSDSERSGRDGGDDEADHAEYEAGSASGEPPEAGSGGGEEDSLSSRSPSESGDDDVPAPVPSATPAPGELDEASRSPESAPTDD